MIKSIQPRFIDMIVISAPAKINLTLSITGKRDDGYHLMQSVVAFAELIDTIRLSADPDLTEDNITITGPKKDELSGFDKNSNIIMKALQAYRDVVGIDQYFQIELEKHIPVGGGVGGGSADAAAALIAINRHHGNSLNNNDLAQIGLTIGADVPVCLAAHHQINNVSFWHMQGIGEELTAIDLNGNPDFGLILTNPGVHVATAQVFGQLSPSDFSQQQNQKAKNIDLDGFKNWLSTGNDLTKAACAIAPAIKTHLDALAALHHHQGFITSGMSGSGATCFALFDRKEDALLAAESLPQSMGFIWSGGMFKSE